MSSKIEKGKIIITSSVKIINLNTGKNIIDSNRKKLERKLVTKGRK